MKLTVKLNGTDSNPFAQWGMTQNPFPQIADYKYAAACLQLQKLGGDPIPNTDYIREVLEGFDPSFVDLCCAKFKLGEIADEGDAMSHCVASYLGSVRSGDYLVYSIKKNGERSSTLGVIVKGRQQGKSHSFTLNQQYGRFNAGVKDVDEAVLGESIVDFLNKNSEICVDTEVVTA